ncbi:MAG: nucleoside-diphosphate kinase [Candidatus Anammoxibacter sp.]
MQLALIIIKPDGVQRKLMGKIISRLEEKGLLIAGLKMMVISKELANEHYADHKGKGFYEALIKYMTSGPVVVMALKGQNTFKVVRKLMGSTFGQEAEPGTIRGDYAISNRFNLIHCSDSLEAAEKEIGLFFKEEELLYNGTADYETADLRWIYDASDGDYV